LFLRLMISAYNLIPDFIKFKIFRTKWFIKMHYTGFEET
jgi:hypothetical protein